MNTMSVGVAGPTEGLSCFVCDGTVIGRYYTLASCKTQVTKQKLVEKLGQLVGDQYMVVISEDDIICRSCTTMMNNLDRLEKEMRSVRSVILRFLEKKYELEEGELANSKIVLPPPPTPPESITAFKKTEKPILSFHERKTQSIKNLGTDEAEKKANVWMQCDRCQYTTPYSSFMINHIHKHSEPKKPEPERTLVQLQTPKKEPDQLEEMPDYKDDLEETSELDIEPELEDEEVNAMTNGDEGGGTDLEEEGAPAVEMDLGDEESICMVDENGILKKVQQSEDGQYYVVEGDDDSSKQMLSVADDGSVQMVQVMWDDIVSADDNIQF